MITKITNDETRKAAALEFFNGVSDLMATLAARWADEKDHEDINDYKTRLAQWTAQHFPTIGIVEMTKRPFGCIFTCGIATYVLKLSLNGKYSYQRTK